MSQKQQMIGRYYAQKRKHLKSLKSGNPIGKRSKELGIKDLTAYNADKLLRGGEIEDIEFK